MLTLQIPIRQLLDQLAGVHAADREKLAESLHQCALQLPDGPVKEALVCLSTVADEGALYMS